MFRAFRMVQVFLACFDFLLVEIFDLVPINIVGECCFSFQQFVGHVVWDCKIGLQLEAVSDCPIIPKSSISSCGTSSAHRNQDCSCHQYLFHFKFPAMVRRASRSNVSLVIIPAARRSPRQP